MKAGFAEVVITPPLGVQLSGYFNERIADGIRDNLHARAMVVSEGNTTVAIVVCDMLAIPYHDVLGIRQEVERRTGIPGSHVLVSATHCHTGPVTDPRFGFIRDEPYLYQWRHLTAGAVEMAFRNATEVRFSVGRGQLPGVGFNRRFRMKNGRVHTNPGYHNNEIDEPAGPTNPTVTVLRFDGMDGKPIGVLTHFSCHPDTVGGNKFSADWVGLAATSLRSLLMAAGATRAGHPPADGPGIVVLNGPAGNINHINVNDPDRQRRWPSSTEEIGIGLAAETMRIITGLGHPCDNNSVGAAHMQVTLAQIPLEQFIAENQAVMLNPAAGSMEKRRAQVNLEMAPSWHHELNTMEVEVQCLRIGPVVVASVPGEAFCEFALALQKEIPNVVAITAGLANGSVGYIPTRQAYAEGGYEPRTTRLEPGSGEVILEAQIKLAHKLLAQ